MPTIAEKLTPSSGIYHFNEGSLNESVLHAIEEYHNQSPFKLTAETGCGRSTLLFSNLSKRHLCFCFSDDIPQDHKRYVYETDNKANSNHGFVSQHPLFKKDVVEFHFGPTQKTLPEFKFKEPFDCVMLDGPHAFPFLELEYYHFYPHVKTGGLLIIDDIQLPTVHRVFDVLADDRQWKLEQVIEQKTAFFRRTEATTLNPYTDGFYLQGYNSRHFPVPYNAPSLYTDQYHPIPEKTEYLKFLRFISQAHPLYIWGTGEYGKHAHFLLKWFHMPLKGFVTGTEKPKDFHLGPVFTPEELPASPQPFFIVATMYKDEVLEQIKKILKHNPKPYEDYLFI